jgi:hypothetical protein
MNLFRSEEHMRNWVQFNPDSAEASLPLNDEIAVYATQAAKHRLDEDFVSKWLPNQAAEIAEVARGLGKTGSFWSLR